MDIQIEEKEKFITNLENGTVTRVSDNKTFSIGDKTKQGEIYAIDIYPDGTYCAVLDDNPIMCKGPICVIQTFDMKRYFISQID